MIKSRRTLLLAAAAIATAGCSHSADTSSPDPVPTAVQSAPPLSADRAETLSATLPSGDEHRIAAVLAPSVRRAFVRHPSRLWPVGCRVDVSVDKFLQSAPDAGTVPAIATCGRRQSTWTLVLTFVDGSWDVVATARQR